MKNPPRKEMQTTTTIEEKLNRTLRKDLLEQFSCELFVLVFTAMASHEIL